MHLKLDRISKSFAAQPVLDQISLEIAEGQLVSLLGPSGCGKTTLLRILAGLDQADRGRVLFNGQDTAGWSLKERGVGLVFQHYALFPHMNVANNISFGLRMRPRRERPSASNIQQRVDELLELVQLRGLGKRYPAQLSGGQRQRVALARALATEPRLLLLDEPFGALDAKVRRELRSWLRELQQRLAITCVLVTHDQEEALDISDHVVLLNHGRIEQEGHPEQLFEEPATAFALDFLSTAQRMPSKNSQINIEEATFVRPHEIEVSRLPLASHGREAQIQRISLRGASARLTLVLAKASPPLQVELSRQECEALDLRVGERVHWQPRRLHTY